jgi:hypothetical protein
VIAEGRALEAEAAAIERPHLSVDHLLRWELPAAGDAYEGLRWPRDWLTRSLERLVWVALETAFTIPKVAPSPADADVYRKFSAANHADQHCADRT